MLLYSILALLLVMARGSDAGAFCDSSAQKQTQESKQDIVCGANLRQSFSVKPPPFINLPGKNEIEPKRCHIAFMLDLGAEFVSPQQFQIVQSFIYGAISECMEKNIGYNVVIYGMFNFDESATVSCCSLDMCAQHIGVMRYEDFVVPYGDTRAIVNETDIDQFTEVLVDDLKDVSKEKCEHNHAVMISNRMFRAIDQDGLLQELQTISENECLTFTQIIIGRGNEISPEDLQEVYGMYQGYHFLVPDINCLGLITGCLRPCGLMSDTECALLPLSSCPDPTLPPTTPSTTTVSTTPDTSLMPYWHLIYVFALSNRTTNEDFDAMVTFLTEPLLTCQQLNYNMTVETAFPHNTSKWLTNMTMLPAVINASRGDYIDIPPDALEWYDETTMELLLKTMLNFPKENAHLPAPMLELVTDFASKTFIDAYLNDNGRLTAQLARYNFEILTFNQETHKIFLEHGFSAQRIHEDDNYRDDPVDFCFPPATTIAPRSGLSSTAVVVIIVATCMTIMILLLLLTCLFKQRYFWMERLSSFAEKTTSNKQLMPSHLDDDIIDYWEMTWDDVIVRNEKIGHGAHGQVFRGKLRGSSPGVEHYFRPEDRVNYVGCECAIKVLPPTATDKARQEFLREIEMMKSTGYNDHIVNILGCITTHKRIGLLLEYCAVGDLLRYLKRKKADLEQTRSIDKQLESTKQFLQFGWQIAHGMEYLQGQGVIHRDLAARNILIDVWGNAKVADFGLCIRIEERPFASTVSSDIVRPDRTSSVVVAGAEGRLPIKWLAIECLQKQHFSVKSDVWSFGIVLFEMYTLGESPFQDIEPTELLDHLLSGGRPSKPLLACDKIYELMSRCWQSLADDRPTFGEILTILAILIEQSTENYGYLQLIKESDIYRYILDPNQNKNRTGSALSSSPSHRSRSGAVGSLHANPSVKEESKMFPGWKKLAATFKARSVFAAATPAMAEAGMAVPEKEKEKSKLKTKHSMKGSRKSLVVMSSPRMSDARERRPNFFERQMSSNSVARPPRPPSFLDDPDDICPIDFDFFRNDNNSVIDMHGQPISICVDGHPVPPVSFPRKRNRTAVAFEGVSRSVSLESLASSEEAFLGRYSYRRGSVVQRRQSMPTERRPNALAPTNNALAP